MKKVQKYKKHVLNDAQFAQKSRKAQQCWTFFVI